MIHTSEIIKIAKDQDTALKLVDVITDIGFDYICNPIDALNYAKERNKQLL
jgi:hypothetical protein